uniref:Uncharacterized protein MANES_15G165400 n=1 Tax=Rhizophora mucronata TaxID=61149 RepID=A0A2P2LQV4_RHIMU
MHLIFVSVFFGGPSLKFHLTSGCCSGGGVPAALEMNLDLSLCRTEIPRTSNHIIASRELTKTCIWGGGGGDPTFTISIEKDSWTDALGQRHLKERRAPGGGRDERGTKPRLIS